ncbi:FMN-dependent NADH-azoreductase [Sphaerotilus uruguayifluvii]|uniref:FMN dependent NADH:quinone oxidoreductase n=1 Tax=Sphaerotilus uruguayifluvii TaxID=2735897 RepID=A0ABX2G4H2_9BURK|nr:NAD(P)H-dependent oxidoreductase [Leptothrix sp. C29]NRT56616.1 FMN-dependent NADH-azoreductase [Leptothrix sp. C29]
MKTLLYVQGSPRGERSKTAQVAQAFLDSYQRTHPQARIDVLELWQAPLPEFDGDRAAAKMSFFGDAAMNDRQRTAWDEIVEIAARFKAADDYLFTVPMWNAGIPYRLKLYIDLLTQPGLLFGFDPDKGYSGLLGGKRSTAIYASGVYAPGLPREFGADFHSSYFDDWLRFIGIEDRVSVRLQPNLRTPDPAGVMAAARAAAAQAGQRRCHGGG